MADRPRDQERFLTTCSRAASRRPERHASEQYRTSPQVEAHFLRQVNGRPQDAQIFDGRSAFFGARPTRDQRASAVRAATRPLRVSTITTRSGPPPAS